MSKKSRFITCIFLALTAIIGIYYYSSRPALASCGGAQTVLINCGPSDSKGSGIFSVVGLITQICTVLVGIVAAIGIVFVGIQYLTSRDNEEQARKAKRRLYHMIIGLAVYVAAFPILNFLIPGGFFNNSESSTATTSETSDTASHTTDSNTKTSPGSDLDNGTEPDAPEKGDTPTGDEGHIDRVEQI